MPKIVNAKHSKVKLDAGVATNQDLNFGENIPTLLYTDNAMNLCGRDNTSKVSTETSTLSILQPLTATMDMEAARNSAIFENDLVKIDTDFKSEPSTYHQRAACVDIYDNAACGNIIVPRGMTATINIAGLTHILQAANDCDLVVKLGDLHLYANDQQS